MSSHTINMLSRAALGVLTVIMITVITLPGPALATHRHFGEQENWTPDGDFYGDLGTYFADFIGEVGNEKVADRKADLIMVNKDGIWVRRANKEGTGFMGKEKRTNGQFYGPRGTFFADVTGDGLADPIAIFDDHIEVRLTESGKRVPSPGRYYGNVGTFFANVDESTKIKADLIMIDWDERSGREGKLRAWVRRSDGYGHFGGPEDWTQYRSFSPGNREKVLVADVTGDKRADLIAVNDENGGIKVSIAEFNSSRTEFKAEEPWTHKPVDFFYGVLANGSQATFVADVNGDNRADIIGINDGTRIVGDDGIGVRESIRVTITKNDTSITRDQFATPDPANGYFITVDDQAIRPWGYWTQEETGETFYGTRGTFFADVTGDGTADAIAVNDDGVFVRRSCAYDGTCTR